MKIDMPQGASYVIEQLNKRGFEAYVVGGCVRDSLLGKKPHDWDITTSATPEEMKEIFRRTVDTGIQHGTVTVLVYPQDLGRERDDGELETYEVTTYRVDGIYEDHRRPKEVNFTSNLTEDLKRRDFTINAMAYNDENGLVDIFGGEEDLAKHIVRCVGNADDRFDEDALRILRAVRFAAQLGFEIEEVTKNAITGHVKYLRDISAERIQVELTKLITSNHPEKIVEAYELGITGVVLPEFDVMMQTEQNNPYHIYTVGMHTVKVMENIAPTPVLRYTALLHDIAKPACKTTDDKGINHFYGHPDKGADMARTILRRLKLDNNTVNMVCKLVKNHDFGIGGNVKFDRFKHFLASLGRENFDELIAIKKADMAGQSDYKLEERNHVLNRLETMYATVIKENQPLYVSDLAVNGNDIITLGVKPGRAVGEVLNALLAHVYDRPEDNKKEILIKMAVKMIDKQ